ncbi:MAG: TldD/PmbA family protein [Bdellovibrionota bacterium]|nr:TldD/PmbA family protein [Bdellovibrionota bacterium]
MNHEQLKKTLRSLPSKGADWIGLKKITSKIKFHSVKNGLPLSNKIYQDEGVQIEVLKNGQFAYSSTQDTSPNGIKLAYEKALFLAESSSKYPIFPFTRETRPQFKNRPSPHDFNQTTSGEIHDVLSLSCDSIKKEKGLIHSEGYAALKEMETYHIGLGDEEFYSSKNIIDFSLKAIAQEGSEVQTRTWGNTLQTGPEYFQKELFKKEATRIAKEARELSFAEQCPSEKMDLLLMPDQMILQIHESIGHPLELDRILGDERNYAGQSFVKLSDFGNYQYGSKALNVTFDPTVETEVASYKMDDTGHMATKEFIIKEGKLLRGLGSLESQLRSNVPGVACGRVSSWNRPPIDRMANLNLEPGEGKFEEMVSSMERGVIMATNKSWSIDDYRNKFQFGCEYAKLVENGRITKTLRNPNYRGITTPFWHNLKEVGSLPTREIFGTAYCGKGEPNQAIEVGHASSVCLFNGIEVFGGV